MRMGIRILSKVLARSHLHSHTVLISCYGASHDAPPKPLTVLRRQSQAALSPDNCVLRTVTRTVSVAHNKKVVSIETGHLLARKLKIQCLGNPHIISQRRAYPCNLLIHPYAPHCIATLSQCARDMFHEVLPM
jgi:hypothetical protein